MSSSRTASRTSRCVAASPTPPAASRLAEHQPARLRRPRSTAARAARSPACAARPGSRAGPGPSRRRRAGRGRTPAGAGVARGRVEHVGVGEDAGSRLAPASETRTRSPRAISAPAELDVAGGVAVDHRRRGLDPQRLLDAPAAGPVGVGQRELAGMRRAGGRTALGIIPSVVSMPPNISTAALATTSSSVSDAGRGGEQRRRPVGRDARVDVRGQGGHRAPRPPVGTGWSAREVGDGVDDRGVPAQHRVRVGRRQAEHVARPRPPTAVRRGRAAAPRVPGAVRAARPGRSGSARRRSPKRSLDPRRPERRDERRPVTGVLLAVEGEHARRPRPGRSRTAGRRR